ncbi:hypothetical protein HPB48_026974 [Haemaphysalis longicornis]|uniref:CCHC-type domain-containing protein n=1 Tax=Haemaphysalis longicornis TaxID=44386 RepID=A0A9J6H2L9_HAELO|nr:hypothetical protein HPB48_026974 [Haemaphysalis longicornis]
MEMHDVHEDPPSEQKNENAHIAWIEVTSCSQRRNMQQLPTTTPLKPALRQGHVARKPKPLPLPADEYKLAIRPRNGLQMSKVSPVDLTKAIAREAYLQFGIAEIKIRIDEEQNVLIKCQTPLWAPNHEPLHYRRVGNTGTFLHTFKGKKESFGIYVAGVITRCYLYKRAVAYCYTCHQVGHRADVCPNPSKMPKHQLECHPKCLLCSGAHSTASKACLHWFLPPMNRRKQVPISTIEEQPGPLPFQIPNAERWLQRTRQEFEWLQAALGVHVVGLLPRSFLKRHERKPRRLPELPDIVASCELGKDCRSQSS